MEREIEFLTLLQVRWAENRRLMLDADSNRRWLES
jgi:hypothetical protein